MKKSFVVTYKYLSLLLFFVPLFIIKGIGLGSSDKVAVYVTILSLTASFAVMLTTKINRYELNKWILIFAVCAINMVLSGKYIILLSVYALFLLTEIEHKKFYKTLIIIAAIIMCYWIVSSMGTGNIEYRFINGMWQEITKRSNTIFVVYFAIINLYILIKEDKIRIIEIIAFAIGGYFLYLFTGTRSGFYCIIVSCICLVIFKMQIVKKSKVIQKAVIASPVLLTLISFFMNYLYGKIDFLSYVNYMLQNRLYFGKMFLDNYGISLFGQKVYTSFVENNYQVMDNTYLNLLINYGLIITILWIVLNIKTLKYLYKNGKYCEICIIIGYLLYAFTESFVVVAFLSVSVFIYSEYLKTDGFCAKKKNSRTEITDEKNNFI